MVQYCMYLLKKNPCISRPTKFQPILFRGQLYLGCTHLSRNFRWGIHWGFLPCSPPDPLPSGYTGAPPGRAPVHTPPSAAASPPRSTAHPAGSYPSSPCTLHSQNSRGSWAAAGTSVLPSSSAGALVSTGSPARARAKSEASLAPTPTLLGVPPWSPAGPDLLQDVLDELLVDLMDGHAERVPPHTSQTAA